MHEDDEGQDYQRPAEGLLVYAHKRLTPSSAEEGRIAARRRLERRVMFIVPTSFHRWV